MAIKLPAKVLRVSVGASTGVDRWPYDDGQGDQWWEGGINPRFYTWDVDVTVTTQGHSSHLSREPYEYNAFDIKVGDWIANATTGKALKVIGVTSKTLNTATLRIEDVNRYNTFRDPGGLGDGSVGSGFAVVFTLNEEGEPLLDTMIAGYISEVFLNNVIGRFQNLNAEYDYILEQPGHTFQEGDLIAADSDTGNWVLASNAYTYVIGRITSVGPTPDQFRITPIQKIIDNLNSLPGDVADILYVDNSSPGNVTATPGETPIYIKLRNETPTSLTSTVSPIATAPGSVLNINGTDVTFTTGDQADILSSINALTGTTGVSASALQAPTLASPNVPDLGYGVVGAIGSTQAGTINGIPFVFDITVSGTIQFGTTAANAVDMANAITRDVTSVDSNIVAYEDSGLLYIRNDSGGAINIATTVTDGSGFNVQGASSTTGLPATTAASTDSSLVITGTDAGVIALDNTTGTPQEDLGIFTVENGIKAAALYIEKGLSSASTTVVADITARDALTPGIGDQAMVLDKGNGEWELYVYDGSVWIPVANQDSARTDADSAEFIVNFNTSVLNEIVTVSTSSRVTLITVEVITPFDGTPTLEVGISPTPGLLFSNDLVDLSEPGTYSSNTDFYFNSGIDTDILVTYNANGATQGQAKIVVSYM